MSDPLWQALCIEPTEERSEIDRAYRAALASGHTNADLRYAWKLLRDPYYRAMRSHYQSREAFRAAGFFDDGLDTQMDAPAYTDLRLLTTPYHKILRRLCQLDEFDPAQLIAYPPIVLLTTGGFSPIHNGHLDMMELAKNAMIEQGHTVLGGYLSPSHDSYVSTKYDGGAGLLDAHRLRLCHEAVATSEWLMVDPWEARYVPRALNFTDVILRLERYLNYHLRLPVPLRVGYVFGGDNAAFVRVFLSRGYGVCIERPGYESLVAAIRQEIPPTNARIAFARPRREIFNISSSQIREEELDAMPERARRAYAALKANAARAAEPPPARRFLIRDESAWAIKPWTAARPEAQLTAARESLLDTLRTALREAYARPPLPDPALHLHIEVPELERQVEYAEALRRETKTITLDACTAGTYRLEVSRLFGLADGQCFSTQVTPRPGCPPITAQIQAIPPGDYALLDDDIASGRTMRMMMAVFPPEIRITRVLSLLEQTRSVEALRVDQVDYQDFYDVVDFRDYLFGSRGSGLVVRLPDREPARVPYLLPYVTLNTRIRMPASQEVAFSLAMWQANARFFAVVEPPIRVEECDPATQRLMHYLGFTDSTPVLEIVQWHLDRLLAIQADRALNL
jgi:nicotinic acid mononucleotide adenylyltransferase